MSLATEADSDNERIVRDYLRAFNERDTETMAELLADDVVEHGAHEELDGFEEITSFLDSYFEVFPDYSGTTEEIVSEGDTVAVRFTASGTHTGEFKDIEPTGHSVEWSGIAMYRIEDGEIAEIWVEEDRLTVLEELEAVNPQHAHLRV